MFNLFEKREPEPPPQRGEVRGTLFGDMPISEWPADPSPDEVEPWASFVAATRLMQELIAKTDGGRAS